MLYIIASFFSLISWQFYLNKTKYAVRFSEFRSTIRRKEKVSNLHFSEKNNLLFKLGLNCGLIVRTWIMNKFLLSKAFNFRLSVF